MARVRPSAGSDLLKVEKQEQNLDGFANVDNLAFDSQGNVWVSLICPLKHTMVSYRCCRNSTNIDHTVIGAVVEGATSDLNVQTSALIGVLAMAVLHSHQWAGCWSGCTLCLWPTPLRDDRANFWGIH